MRSRYRWRVLGVLLVTLVLSFGCRKGDEPRIGAERAADSLDSLVTGYIERYFATFPSRATAAGRHDFDDQLEVLDEETRVEWLRYNQEWLDAFELQPPSSLAAEDPSVIDARLVERQASRTIFLWGQRRQPERDPTFWTGRLSNAPVFLLVRHDLPAEQRYNSIAKRAALVPALVESALVALAREPQSMAPERVASAARQARNAVPLWNRDILAAWRAEGSPGGGELEAQLRVGGEAAAAALMVLVERLGELEEEAQGTLRLGNDYQRLFTLLHGSDPLAEIGAAAGELPRFADVERVLEVAEGALLETRGRAADYGRSVWSEVFPDRAPPGDMPDREVLKELFERVGEDHAETVEEFVEDYRALLLEAEAFARRTDIVTLPDPLTVKTSASPEFFSGQAVGGVYPAGPWAPEADTLFYLPTPPADFSDEQRGAFFRDFNHHFNVMITAHEMIPGHYLQLKVAARSPRKVRALFSDGVMTEGWGSYSEIVMLDAGWGGPLDRLAHLKKQLENIARTIVDIRVHTEDMSRDEVLEFVQTEALQDQHFAANMWSRAISSAPQITSYWLGQQKVQRIDEAARVELGDAYRTKHFVDAMVAEGSIPLDDLRPLVLARLRRR